MKAERDPGGKDMEAVGLVVPASAGHRAGGIARAGPAVGPAGCSWASSRIAVPY
jgi:hypothetical protein